MTWTVEFLNDAVEAELESLPIDIRARFTHIVQLVQTFGLQHMHKPYIEHLQDKLWEMRMHGRDGIARAVYVTAAGKRVVVVRVFVKKTQKTPRSEIELALKRAKGVQ
jgi:phage-related protein